MRDSRNKFSFRAPYFNANIYQTRGIWGFVFAVLVSLLTLPHTVAGAEKRVAVVIGSNVGLQHEQPLQFAERDAKRFYNLLTEVGGLSKERAYLVLGGDARAVRRAIDEAKGRIHELSKRGPSVLIVYVSSHADEEALHLEGTQLPIRELRETVQDTPAHLRLVVIDACRTPVQAAQKGLRTGPPVTVNLHRNEQLEGDLFISSSSAGEPAQEWDFFRGALFTHHLITGLRGAADINQDGLVSLAESYTYAFQRTSAGSINATPGAQHPSFDFQMKGFGDWTFTQPIQQGSAILVDADIESVIWVVDRNNNIVAEVNKTEYATLRLAMAPGWYRVIMPDGNYAKVADMDLSWGMERRLRSDSLVRMRLKDVATRGERPVVLRPFRFSIRYYWGNGSLDGVGFLHYGALGLQFVRNYWASGLSLAATGTRFRTDWAKIKHFEGDLQLTFGREIPLPRVSLSLGILAGVTRAHQVVVANDDSQRSELGFAAPNPRKGWMPRTGAFASLDIPLTERLVVEINTAAAAEWVPVVSKGYKVAFDGRLGVGFGIQF